MTVVSDDERLAEARRRGELICRCAYPIPQLVLWGNAVECTRCGRPVVLTAEEICGCDGK